MNEMVVIIFSLYSCVTLLIPENEFFHDEDIYVMIRIVYPNYNEYFWKLSLRLDDSNKLPVFTIHEPLNALRREMVNCIEFKN